MRAGAGLARVIAEATQPYSSQPSGDLLRSLQVCMSACCWLEWGPESVWVQICMHVLCTHTGAGLGLHLCLQKYLADEIGVDSVYKALILRAWAEPLRWVSREKKAQKCGLAPAGWLPVGSGL